jgi:hypothetical protein
MFVALLLLVHSASAVVLGRPHTARRTTSLAFFAATGLPLIVATVSIGITRGAIGPDVGASLIGAGMVSVLLFPIIAMRIERPRTVERFSDAGNGRGRTNRLRRDPGKRPALRPL